MKTCKEAGSKKGLFFYALSLAVILVGCSPGSDDSGGGSLKDYIVHTLGKADDGSRIVLGSDAGSRQQRQHSNNEEFHGCSVHRKVVEAGGS